MKNWDKFNHLNSEQKEAVENFRGAVLVTAPVGTGKTSVISHRATNAVLHGVDPNRILCMTFTNRAAKEMKDRMVTDIGPRAQDATIKTFHGLCADIIRVEAELLGIPRDFTIFDEEDAKTLVRDIVESKNIQVDNSDRYRFINFIMGFINSVKSAKTQISQNLMEDPYEGSKEEWLAKLDDCFHDLLKRQYFKNTSKNQEFCHIEIFQEYNTSLGDNHALDFADLEFYVAQLLTENIEAKERWQNRFSFMQVDEVQDTNLQEYQIISELSDSHGNLSLFGDSMQTVYEWRGSKPEQVIKQFKRDFSPVKEITLTKNYRSTKNILRACWLVVKNYYRDYKPDIWPQSEEEGEQMMVLQGINRQNEAELIANQINRLVSKQQIDYKDIAVLTRTNNINKELSEQFTEMQIPHFTVDHFKFFRRTEIKDAMAYLKMLNNRYDFNSFRRILQKPPRGIGDQTIEQLMQIPPEIGLKLVDFANTDTLKYRDPYARLTDKIIKNQVVVFDVETTGLDTKKDEIIELAAIKVSQKGIVARFHELLKNTRAVGDSYHIHGISDEVLADKGKPPEKVLASFLNFIEDCELVGHNVNYDITMLQTQLRKKLDKELDLYGYDTVDISRRFMPGLSKYNLASLCQSLKIDTEPTHRAMDDVEATFELLKILLEYIEPGTEKRKVYVDKYGEKFVNLAIAMNSWRNKMETTRPPKLLANILRESGLGEYWKKDSKRHENLKELIAIFRHLDDQNLAPVDALNKIIEQLTLGNDSDRQIQDKNNVALLTVHQAKGLEFDAVFIAGADDSNFPYFKNKKENKIDEEHRLFYVAMTRAKKFLCVSYAQKDENGYPQSASRFLRLIPSKYLNFVSVKF